MSRQPIPDAALDDRLFFGGTAGSGKTYNAMSRVERLLARKSRVVIPDPLGVWWGLRLSADGKRPSGYDVVIFGGPHGDLPLTEHAGALIGETVAGMKESCILDLSQLGTKAAERRFMLAFLTALYRHTPGEPLHVVFDEADMWAPQKLFDKEGDAAKLLGMMETIVRRGRVKGFIPWLISQRPAVITKDILSQADGIVAFKLTSSQDRKAIEAWVDGQADAKTWDTISAQLPMMERGQGLVWIPGRGILTTVQFPEKETFDSSRTPKRGEKLKRTAALKPIDLGAVKDRLATVEVETKANDPKALRAALAKATAEKTALERRIEPVAAPSGKSEKATAAIYERSIKQLTAALEIAMKFIVEINAQDFFKAGGASIDQKAVEKAIGDATAHVTRLIERHLAQRDKQLGTLRTEGERVIKRLKAIIDQDVTVKVEVRHNEPFTIAASNDKLRPARAIISAPAGDGTFTGPQMKVLRSLAMWRALGHDAPSREMVAAVAGYSPSSGGYNNLLGGLASAGAIGKPMQGCLSLLTEGIEVIGKDDGRDLLIATLSNPQRKIIGALVDTGTKTRDDVGAATGYSPSSGGFNNLLGSLGTLGILVKPQQGCVALSDWAQELLSGCSERLAA
jgi:hypothetical protein